MKRIIDRVFPRKDEPSASPQHGALSSELTVGDIEAYYLGIVSDVFRRMLVPAESIEVGVKRLAAARSGRTSFAAWVRILRWDPVLMPVLLQNLPVIEGRVRKVIAASVILEQTHFAGLWMQASSHIEGAPTQLVGMPTELIRERQPGP
jgi:hypothetical protein